MSQEATRRALTAMGLFVALVAIVVVYLVIVEQDDRAALSGVGTAGPCRSAYSMARDDGATPSQATKAATLNPECQQQSRLLFETCVTQELHPACALADQALKQQKKAAAASEPSGDSPQGGGPSSSSPPASSQPSPSPPSGGPPVTPPGNPPTQPPTNPPTNPPDNGGGIDDVVDGVCDTTSGLGLPLCLN